MRAPLPNRNSHRSRTGSTFSSASHRIGQNFLIYTQNLFNRTDLQFSYPKKSLRKFFDRFLVQKPLQH